MTHSVIIFFFFCILHGALYYYGTSLSAHIDEFFCVCELKKSKKIDQ